MFKRCWSYPGRFTQDYDNPANLKHSPRLAIIDILFRLSLIFFNDMYIENVDDHVFI